MIIVFISGLVSGLVRLGTLTLRSLLAFCLTSAASYFLLMLFEMYEARVKKEIAEVEAELVEDEESEESNEETANGEQAEQNNEGFQPMNPADLPNAGRQ